MCNNLIWYQLFIQEPDANYIMQLTIKNMNASDSGIYYCNAQNNFGTFAQVMKLQARQKAVKHYSIHPLLSSKTRIFIEFQLNSRLLQ